MIEYDKKSANIKRLRKFLKLRKKNLQLAYDIDRYVSANQYGALKTREIMELKQLRKSITCCGTSLLLHEKADYMEFVTSVACDHKLCQICNHNRKNLVRKKYILFFAENPSLWVDRVDGKIKTASQCRIKGAPVNYTLLSLTLSVPHPDGLYRGKRFYYEELIDNFNYLRKMNFWVKSIYGGEFGVETTITKANGFHIHIHSLLMVADGHQNRNALHREILLNWNRITVNPDSAAVWTEERVREVMKGNRSLTRDDVLSMNPKGATHISLTNIFIKDKETGKRVYVDNYEARVNAILEVISYHYKPKMYDMGDGHSDISLLIKSYMALKGKRLYSRFGVLYHERTLGMDNYDTEEDLKAAKEVEAAIERNEPPQLQELAGTYYKVRSSAVHVDDTDNVMFQRKDAMAINTMSTRNAINILYSDSGMAIGGKSRAIQKQAKKH